MLYPNPISLLCALLLSLPLALFFTITTPNHTFQTNLTTISIVTTIDRTQIRNIPFTILAKNPNRTQIHHFPFNFTAIADDFGGGSPLPTIYPPRPPPRPPPRIRVDYRDDRILLQKASRVDSNPASNSPRKIAFMFMTTKSLPFMPLWQLYFTNAPSNLYNIYIHTNPSVNDTESLFHGVFSKRVIPSKPTRRNTPTLSSAARRLLAHALLHDPSNSHFALVSASCIPLHSFQFTYDTVISSRKSFIEILDNEENAYERWAARGEHAMLPEVEFDDFRIGSQFWILTRQHARVVVSDRRLWKKFKLPCLRWDTCYPEENYFPTLLNKVDARGCLSATLTHVDWSDRDDGHPRMYVAREVDSDLIQRLRSDRPRYGDETNGSDPSLMERTHPFLFARKFSPKSLQPLMSLAEEIILGGD